MAKGNTKKEIELPTWTKEVPWYQQQAETALVPVEEPQIPWYLEEPAPRYYQETESEVDSTDQQFFRKLITMIDEHGWMRGRIDESVQRWLQNHDHYRFVYAVRPVAEDWVDVLKSLGVKEDHARQVRVAIENQLAR